MVTIQRSMLSAHWRALAVISAVLAVALTMPIARLSGLAPLSVLLGTSLLIFMAVAALVSSRFLPLSFDPSTGTAQVGHHAVALSEFRSATRSVAAGHSHYLSYRFTAGTIHARILVVGSPIKGLTDDELTALRDFLTRLDLEQPPTADREELVVANAFASGRANPVGQDSLLAEIDELLTQRRSTTHGHQDISPVAPPSQAARRPEDESAEAWLSQFWHGSARRFTFWCLFGCVLTLVMTALILQVLVLFGVIDRQWRAPLPLALIGIPGSLLSLTAWCVAADAHTRLVRRAGEHWLASHDPTRERMPAVMVTAWTESAERLRNLMGVVLGLVGGVVTLLSIAILLIGEDGVSGPMLGFAVGLVMLASALALWRSARARRERALRFAAGLAPAEERDD